MSEEAAEANSTPRKKSKLIFIILPLVLVIILAAGGGAYFYFFRASAQAEKGKNGKSAKDKKKSSKAAEEDSAETAAEENEKKAHGEDKNAEGEKPATNDSLQAALPEDGEVKKVIELQPFIVNLADTEPRFLRLTISLGIGEGEGGESEKPDALFVTRVRNAILAVLASKKSDDILSVEGKTKLRKELLQAAQAASEEPHAEAIYITDFIVQL